MAEAQNPAEAAGLRDPVDARGVPVSTGIPPLVRVAVATGLLIIFAMLGVVVYASSYGHAWPASDSTKLKL